MRLRAGVRNPPGVGHRSAAARSHHDHVFFGCHQGRQFDRRPRSHDARDLHPMFALDSPLAARFVARKPLRRARDAASGGDRLPCPTGRAGPRSAASPSSSLRRSGRTGTQHSALRSRRRQHRRGQPPGAAARMGAAACRADVEQRTDAAAALRLPRHRVRQRQSSESGDCRRPVTGAGHHQWYACRLLEGWCRPDARCVDRLLPAGRCIHRLHHRSTHAFRLRPLFRQRGIAPQQPVRCILSPGRLRNGGYGRRVELLRTQRCGRQHDADQPFRGPAIIGRRRQRRVSHRQHVRLGDPELPRREDSRRPEGPVAQRFASELFRFQRSPVRRHARVPSPSGPEPRIEPCGIYREHTFSQCVRADRVAGHQPAERCPLPRQERSRGGR